MAKTAWNRLPGDVPADGATVWIRRVWFAAPFLATWDEVAQEFTTANGLTLSWAFVDTWRAED